MPRSTELYRRGCATLVASWAHYARGSDAAAVREALDGMEAAYEAAGVRRFAAWVHDGEQATRVALEARGYALDTATRAMGMALRDLPAPRSDIEVVPGD